MLSVIVWCLYGMVIGMVIRLLVKCLCVMICLEKGLALNSMLWGNKKEQPPEYALLKQIAKTNVVTNNIWLS